MKISELKPVKIITAIVKFHPNGEFTRNIVGKYGMSRFWGQRGKLILRISSWRQNSPGLAAGASHLKMISNNFLYFSQERPAIGIPTREKVPEYHIREVLKTVPFYIDKADIPWKTQNIYIPGDGAAQARSIGAYSIGAYSKGAGQPAARFRPETGVSGSRFLQSNTLINMTTWNMARDKLKTQDSLEKQPGKLKETVYTRHVYNEKQLFGKAGTEAENSPLQRTPARNEEHSGIKHGQAKEPLSEAAPRNSAHGTIKTGAAEPEQELKYFKVKGIAADIIADIQPPQKRQEQINQAGTAGRSDNPEKTAAQPEQAHGQQRSETSYAPPEPLRLKSLRRLAEPYNQSGSNMTEPLEPVGLNQIVTRNNRLLEHKYFQKVNAHKSFNNITDPQLTKAREVWQQGEDGYPAAVQADKEILGYLQKSGKSGLILHKPKQEKPQSQGVRQEEGTIPVGNEAKEGVFTAPKAAKVSIADSPQEVNLIAEKVLGMLEKRLGILKDRRGLR